MIRQASRAPDSAPARSISDRQPIGGEGSTGLPGAALLSVLALAIVGASIASAEEPASGLSFVDDFDRVDTSRWYISDGWTNGNHQNCIWSKRQVQLADGFLRLVFEKREIGEHDYACAEIQTKRVFGHGVYEVRFRTARGSGLNAAFFTYIGGVHGKPHDEIDFEVLTRDTSKVQVNAYVAGTGGNEKLVPLENGTDADFNDYAFVWEEDRLRWYVNGRLVHSITDRSRIPQNLQKIYLSFWSSDNLTEWMGPFVEPEKPLSLDIERVAYTALGEPCQFRGSVACQLQ